MLMFSLKNTPASTASLLLNFEGVATTIIAVVAFKEAVGKRIWMAVLLITMASILLSWGSSGQWGFSLGAVGVLSACVLWGIDNNLHTKCFGQRPSLDCYNQGIKCRYILLNSIDYFGFSVTFVQICSSGNGLRLFQLRTEYRTIYSSHERTRVC